MLPPDRLDALMRELLAQFPHNARGTLLVHLVAFGGRTMDPPTWRVRFDQAYEFHSKSMEQWREVFGLEKLGYWSTLGQALAPLKEAQTLATLGEAVIVPSEVVQSLHFDTMHVLNVSPAEPVHASAHFLAHLFAIARQAENVSKIVKAMLRCTPHASADLLRASIERVLGVDHELLIQPLQNIFKD